MSNMRDLMEMVGGGFSVGPRDARQSIMDALDRVLGNQYLSKAERAAILEEVASTATRMARGLRQRQNIDDSAINTP